MRAPAFGEGAAKHCAGAVGWNVRGQVRAGEEARGAAPCRSNDRRCVRVIGEKTPNNLVYFSPLKQLFAKAKFLDVVRDGRDCIVSTWFHNPRTNPAELQRRHPSFEDFAESLAASWKAWVEGGMRFGESRPDRCIIVRYEDLSLRPPEPPESIPSLPAARVPGPRFYPLAVANRGETKAAVDCRRGSLPGSQMQQSFDHQPSTLAAASGNPATSHASRPPRYQ